MFNSATAAEFNLFRVRISYSYLVSFIFHPALQTPTVQILMGFSGAELPILTKRGGADRINRSAFSSINTAMD
jgi:hypothetical protein